MSELDLQLLERYIDGEVSADERHEVEQSLATHEEWQEAHADLLATRTAVRAHFEALTANVSFDGLWEAIEAELPEGAPAPEMTPAPMAAPPAESAFDRLRAWWRGHWPTVVISAGAAAAVAFYVGRGNEPTPKDNPPPMADNGSGAGTNDNTPAPKLRPAPNAPLPPSVDAPDLKPAGQVVVDAVHSEGGNRVLITQPEGDSPTVIWLLDDANESPKTPDATPVEDPI